MDMEIREIRCELLAILEKEYPTEIAVIREVLLPSRSTASTKRPDRAIAG